MNVWAIQIASCICCHEAPAVKRVLERLATQHGIEVQCIVDHPGFEPICLNVFVLEATYQRYAKIWGKISAAPNEYWNIYGTDLQKIPL
uniref:uncharacterized protein LOC120339446 isoform X2 n=1 Tax=Styela clava TaxID=7725 RepID=UPI0019394B29|nr:uncharacterized protein LOC120339446 isoform X2 [Styela clava]